MLPGDYVLTVRFRGESREVKVTVLPDPRVAIPLADRQAKDALRAQREQLDRDLHRATQRFARSQREIEVVRQRLALEPKAKPGTTDPDQALRDALEAVTKARTEVEERLWGKPPRQGINREDDGLMTEVRTLMRISGTDDAPNRTETEAMARAAAKVPAVTAAVDTFVSGPLTTFRTAVGQSRLSLLPGIEPVPARQ